MSIIPSPFNISLPTGQRLPMIVSVPHCGVAFPEALESMYHPEHVKHPDDTDWFVQDLYDFALELGITMVSAQYSRYVIDLNRDPESLPLYDDGRTVTGLVSSTTFLEEPLYQEQLPDEKDVSWRKEHIYWPYHNALREQLDSLRDEFPHVLLWEAHSIRRMVPTIRSGPFPDMILGDADGSSAAPRLSATVRKTLDASSGFGLSYNDPFKGGYITRSFGAPKDGIHALQLEMSKELYMDEERTIYLPEKANRVRAQLERAFVALLAQLEVM